IAQGPVKNFDLSLLQIRSTDARGLRFWSDAISRFVNTNLITGRIADAEYEFWQNAEDPLQYDAASRPYDHLPRISNGLPYPLEKQIIDTSRNPGRRVLRRGFVEAIGALMWLGKVFFERVRSWDSVIASACSFSPKQLAPGLLEFSTYDRCFTQPNG